MFSTNQTFTNYHDCCNASSQGICNALGKPYGSLYFSGKLPTYRSPKPTLTLTSHFYSACEFGENFGSGAIIQGEKVSQHGGY